MGTPRRIRSIRLLLLQFWPKLVDAVTGPSLARTRKLKEAALTPGLGIPIPPPIGLHSLQRARKLEDPL